MTGELEDGVAGKLAQDYLVRSHPVQARFPSVAADREHSRWSTLVEELPALGQQTRLLGSDDNEVGIGLVDELSSRAADVSHLVDHVDRGLVFESPGDEVASQERQVREDDANTWERQSRTHPPGTGKLVLIRHDSPWRPHEAK